MEATTTREPEGFNSLGTQKIGTLIRRFAIPSIIGMLVNALYNIVDQIFIGQGIGTLGMAATNVALPLTTLGTAVSLLVGLGGAANFNLNMGRGDKERAAQIAGNGLGMMVLFGMVLGVLALVFVQPMLTAFGATAENMPYAYPYTLIIALGTPFLVFATAGCHMIRADGSPKYAMVCMLAGAVFNLIFDPVFLFVFHMGIEGIAWATALGQMLSSAIALGYFLKSFKTVQLTKACLRLRAQYVKAICALGMASMFNQLAMSVVQIALNNVLRYYGAQSIYGSEIPLACVGAISKLNIVFMSFTIGIAVGCQPIVGFNYGAKNYARVKETYKYAATTVTIIAVIAFLIFQLIPRQVISIFGPGTEEYFTFAVSYMRIYLFMTFANGLQPITANFFTSIGKAKLGLFMSLTRQILFLLPLILILPALFGIDGIMYAGPIADAVAAAFAIVFMVREFRIMTAAQYMTGQLASRKSA